MGLVDLPTLIPYKINLKSMGLVYVYINIYIYIYKPQKLVDFAWDQCRYCKSTRSHGSYESKVEEEKIFAPNPPTWTLAEEKDLRAQGAQGSHGLSVSWEWKAVGSSTTANDMYMMDTETYPKFKKIK